MRKFALQQLLKVVHLHGSAKDARMLVCIAFQAMGNLFVWEWPKWPLLRDSGLNSAVLYELLDTDDILLQVYGLLEISPMFHLLSNAY